MITIYEVVSDYGYGDIYIHEIFSTKEEAETYCKENKNIGFDLEHLYDSYLIHHIKPIAIP